MDLPNCSYPSCGHTWWLFLHYSSYRWALSGTPLQNRVGELYSLVQFLQIVPYSYCSS
ncbi:hypothetical protein AAHE18_18G145800 [Arachis hypogaea]